MNSPNSADVAADLVAQVQDACAHKRKITIRGNSSKSFLLAPQATNGSSANGGSDGQELRVAAHSGVVSYEPTELVVTARCGTSLDELVQTLAASSQQLPFEPPVFNGRDTLGGVIACGLSGPARPYAGSARDYVLGMRVINGRGEHLRFGGEVMKNVAGYDVSRLHVGAMGTLGVITEVSMKVLPLPQSQRTLVIAEASADRAITFLVGLARKPLPVSATAYHQGKIHIRLSGSAAAVDAATAQLGGEVMSDEVTSEANTSMNTEAQGPDHGTGQGTGSESFWAALRNHQQPFFSDSKSMEKTLWRVSVPDYTPQSKLSELGEDDDWLIEWGGAQRWVRTSLAASRLFEIASQCGGYATCYSASDMPTAGRQPLEQVKQHLHNQLRLAFDPELMFNPGQFYGSQ